MSRIWRRGSFQWSWECGARKFANSWNGTRLRWITLPEGPEAEGLERSRADAVGAAVYAEEESVGPGGDQVAVAVGAETPVLVMLFDVTPNLLQVKDDLPAWAEKEILVIIVGSLQPFLHGTRPGAAGLRCYSSTSRRAFRTASQMTSTMTPIQRTSKSTSCIPLPLGPGDLHYHLYSTPSRSGVKDFDPSPGLQSRPWPILQSLL